MDTSSKELSVLIDAYGDIRQQRLDADKMAARLKEQENAYKNELLVLLRGNGIKQMGGTRWGVKFRTKEKPRATDWNAIYQYVYENKAADLFQKRLTEEAVKLRREDGIEIPGIEMVPVDDVTVSVMK